MADPAPDADPTPWLTKAISYIGVHEVGSSNFSPQIAAWEKEQGFKIEPEPWCAIFVGGCLVETGREGSGTEWALDYAQWGQELDGPAVGAIVPIKRPGGGHVFFVLGKDSIGRIVGVGGNQSDQVSRAAFPLSRINHGYRWPADDPLPDETGMDSLPVINADGSTKED